MTIQNLTNRLHSDEAGCWHEIQLLRKANIPLLLARVGLEVPVPSPGAPENIPASVQFACETLRKIFGILQDVGLPYHTMDPGHGVGHIMRDYLNALRLMPQLVKDVGHAHVFLGMVAGVTHDLGCALIPRFKEGSRVVRHAEASALLILEIAKYYPEVLSFAQAQLIAYAVAAHAHYLKPSTVVCESDGVVREVQPYPDLGENGEPIWFVWFTRWVDRLDTNGPAFVGRHYLTLARAHEDYGGEVHGHFWVTAAQHLLPILRTSQEQAEAKAIGGSPQTMLEHLRMFADSQTNSSPYGRHDLPAMQILRDSQTARLRRIIHAVNSRVTEAQFDDVNRRWHEFLLLFIEPSGSGLRASHELEAMFSELPASTRLSWASGFLETIYEYDVWSSEMRVALEDFSHWYSDLPGYFDCVRSPLR